MTTIPLRCTNSACANETIVTTTRTMIYLLNHVQTAFCPFCGSVAEIGEIAVESRPQQPAQVHGTVQSIVCGDNAVIDGVVMSAGVRRTDQR